MKNTVWMVFDYNDQGSIRRYFCLIPLRTIWPGPVLSSLARSGPVLQLGSWYRSELPANLHSPVWLKLRLWLTFRTVRTAISISPRPPVTLAFRNAIASSFWSQRAPVMFEITEWRKGHSFTLQEKETSWEPLWIWVKKLKQLHIWKKSLTWTPVRVTFHIKIKIYIKLYFAFSKWSLF